MEHFTLNSSLNWNKMIKIVVESLSILLIMIEGSNIEYGNIEKCNIDSDLRSKNLRLVISKKSDSNIKFNFENSNIDTKTGSNGVPRGVKRGHSIPYHHQQSPPTPRDPVWRRWQRPF